ncbi:MAG: hypothetical protein A2X22_14160 [Bacteroidetes bacterium GWF2_49_14]|nr:MAG: hypothetical protein A2X22_14160 [Bacteroidetes bacterium GWF2_49_14]
METPGDFRLSDLVSDVEIIELDTVKDAYFVNSMGLTLTDHFICFACDIQKKAYLFDRSGKFIRNVGRVGKGPGEYVWPRMVAVSPDERYIVVGDESTRKLILYDINGQYIRERRFKEDNPAFTLVSMAFKDNGNFMVTFRRPSRPVPGFASILTYDLNLKVVQRILPRSADPEEAMSNLSYMSMIRSEDGFCFWETYKDTLYYIDKEGMVEPQYHIGIKNHCFSMGFGLPEFDSSGKQAICTMIMDVLDLPDRLFIDVIHMGESRNVLYDKKLKRAFSIGQPIACDTADNSWVKTSVINDVFGIEPINISNYNPDKKEIIARVMPGWAVDSHDITCLRQRNVTLPAIRDRLADLIESADGVANMAIVVMKLK